MIKQYTMTNEHAKNGFVIAIDGPAASGKGTIVQLLTEHLHGINIYTGGMYRALALKCIQNNIAFENTKDVIATLHNSEIDLGSDDSLGTYAHIFLDKTDVTDAIRIPDVAIGAGKVGQIPEVRDEMVKRQHDLAKRLVDKGKVVIIDGQDVAMYIYPEAEVKIFLIASQEERAKRRQKQYQKKGIDKNLEQMLAEMQTRDTLDWGRDINALSSDPEKDGYFVLDSTKLNEQETEEIIIKELRKRGLYV